MQMTDRVPDPYEAHTHFERALALAGQRFPGKSPEELAAILLDLREVITQRVKRHGL